jgi:hypothetical protein
MAQKSEQIPFRLVTPTFDGTSSTQKVIPRFEYDLKIEDESIAKKMMDLYQHNQDLIREHFRPARLANEKLKKEKLQKKQRLEDVINSEPGSPGSPQGIPVIEKVKKEDIWVPVEQQEIEKYAGNAWKDLEAIVIANDTENPSDFKMYRSIDKQLWKSEMTFSKRPEDIKKKFLDMEKDAETKCYFWKPTEEQLAFFVKNKNQSYFYLPPDKRNKNIEHTNPFDLEWTLCRREFNQTNTTSKRDIVYQRFVEKDDKLNGFIIVESSVNDEALLSKIYIDNEDILVSKRDVDKWAKIVDKWPIRANLKMLGIDVVPSVDTSKVTMIYHLEPRGYLPKSVYDKASAVQVLSLAKWKVEFDREDQKQEMK